MNIKDQKEVSPQFVCQCVSEGQESSNQDPIPSSVIVQSCHRCPMKHQSKAVREVITEDQSCSDSGSKTSQTLSCDCAQIDQNEHGTVQQDQLPGPCREIQAGDPGSRQSGRLGSHPSPDLRGSSGLCHGLREVQTGTSFQGSSQGQAVHQLVCGNLQQQSASYPCSTTPLCPTACRTPGEGHEDPSQEQGFASSCPDKQADWEPVVKRPRTRGVRDRELGTNSSTSTRSDRPAGSHGPDGEHDATDPEPLDPRLKCRPAELIHDQPVLTTIPEVEPDWLEQCLQAIKESNNDKVVDPYFFLEPFVTSQHSENWVSQEMWAYFRTKGDVQKQFQTSRHDLMEIYCSQESELTKQGSQLGLVASRFGLRDGDLSTEQGRRCLYDRLWNFRPSHVWMSPKCRAWCRWATFNMHRSPVSAQKVLSSREEDRVHLLLCSALMELQHYRIGCHFHLEQPVGSHMMFQEEMQVIVANTRRVTCDMCVAGQLKHPDTGKLIRKATQVFTSSAIMERSLENLKCPRNHPHSQVEGSCTLPNGSRCPVSRFTELYTRTFARNVCKALKCSLRVQEAVVALPEVICPAIAAGDGKRRRIGEKQEPPAAYHQINPQKAQDDFVQAVIPHAPKVGKRVFFEGPIFHQCQELFPDRKVVAIEACKGADRYRLPPAGVTKKSAPLRWSMGCHRNEAGNFSDNQWEDWSILTRKQVLRKCPPARLLITIFARHPDEDGQVDPSDQKRKTSSSESEHPAKRLCVTDPSQKNEPSKVDSSITETNSQIKCHSHGPRFSSLPTDIQAQLLKLHKNLGHPDNQLLARVLKDQQWDSRIIDNISDMVCPACFENQKPRLARPAHISRDREFNDLLMIDGIEWTSQEGIKHLFYHMIDAAANFHIAIPAECRSSQHLIELIKTHWITWAGAPRTLMSDSAGEFLQ